MSPRRSPARDPRRGSVLVASLVIALAMMMVLAALMRSVHTENRITRGHLLHVKSDLATQGVAEFGAAQVKARLDQVDYFPADEFVVGVRPPSLPTGDTLEGVVGSIVGNANSAVGGLIETVGGLLGGGNSSGTGAGGGSSSGVGNASSTANPASESFRYEVSPESLVVGRFNAWHSATINSSQALYNGDPLNGQTVLLREVEMIASARVADHASGAARTDYCEQILQVRDTPLSGYALFYNMDLEIAPGAAMDVYGPVHSNGSIFVQSGAGLGFHGIVTTARDVKHGRAPGAESAGTAAGAVTFRKDDATQVSMLQGGVWIDSTSPTWTSTASQLWNGNVRSASHGTNPASPAAIPIYVPDQPSTGPDELQNSAHVLIEPSVPVSSSSFPGNEIEVQKFASKASIVLKVSSSGTVSAYKYTANSSGAYVRQTTDGPARFDRTQINVPSGLIVGGAASQKFYDGRRAKWIDVVDIDVSVLKNVIETSASSQWTNILTGVGFNPASEWNGVLYVESNDTSDGAVRLVNGSSLPQRSDAYAEGFTVATNVPAYVKGNYNADGSIPSNGVDIRNPDVATEPPALIAADAISILSNAWLDSRSNGALSARTASATEVSAALITGIVPTNKNGNATYSGGVENLPRFLETWSGVNFGYRGSMIVLYESAIATEPWGSSNVYNPPNRIWGYNARFESGARPPGIPYSRWYRRLLFRELTASEFQTEYGKLTAP